MKARHLIVGLLSFLSFTHASAFAQICEREMLSSTLAGAETLVLESAPLLDTTPLPPKLLSALTHTEAELRASPHLQNQRDYADALIAALSFRGIRVRVTRSSHLRPSLFIAISSEGDHPLNQIARLLAQADLLPTLLGIDLDALVQSGPSHYQPWIVHQGETSPRLHFEGISMIATGEVIAQDLGVLIHELFHWSQDALRESGHAEQAFALQRVTALNDQSVLDDWFPQEVAEWLLNHLNASQHYTHAPLGYGIEESEAHWIETQFLTKLIGVLPPRLILSYVDATISTWITSIHLTQVALERYESILQPGQIDADAIRSYSEVPGAQLLLAPGSGQMVAALFPTLHDLEQSQAAPSIRESLIQGQQHLIEFRARMIAQSPAVVEQLRSALRNVPPGTAARPGKLSLEKIELVLGEILRELR